MEDEKDILDEKREEYNFLFEDKKHKNYTTSGASIFLIFFGISSFVLCFIDWIFAMFFAFVGIMIAKFSSYAAEGGIGKAGLMLCRISVVLSPSILLIRILLSLLFGLSIMSSLTSLIFM
jgi:hypothetical protein